MTLFYVTIMNKETKVFSSIYYKTEEKILSEQDLIKIEDKFENIQIISFQPINIKQNKRMI